MTMYSDGLSQIRENIEWFFESSKKDEAPSNEERMQQGQIGGLMPRGSSEKMKFLAEEFERTKYKPIVQDKEKPKGIMTKPLASGLPKSKDTTEEIPENFAEQQSLDNWVLALQEKQEKPPVINKTINEVQSSVFTDEVLADNEGVEASDVVTGIKTQSFGVVHSKGLNRKDFNTDKAFAAAVVQKHYEELNKKFTEGGHNIKEAPLSVQYAFLDLHYNNGNIGKDTVPFFDKNNMTKALNNTLEFVGTKTSKGNRIALPSLASRRVRMYNKAAEELKNKKIYSISMLAVNGKTEVVYRDVDENIIHSFLSSRALANVSRSGVSMNRKSATWNRVTDKWTYQ